MCVPRFRRSRTEVRRRRASFWNINAVSVGECPHCHEPKRPHRICKKCGFYNGKDVLKLKQDKEA